MTQEEIRKEIEHNNELIEKIFSPGEFTLNNMASELIKKNRELQNMCRAHVYENGFCIYCLKQEDNNECN